MLVCVYNIVAIIIYKMTWEAFDARRISKIKKRGDALY